MTEVLPSLPNQKLENPTSNLAEPPKFEIGLEVRIMLAAGLEDNEIIRLAQFKHQVNVGQADDLTPEYKRSMFLKHLYTAGLIQG